jgi:hypothetical protein
VLARADRGLIVIIVFAFCLRILIAFFSGLTWFNTDTLAYFDMARAIRMGHPISYLPNGYPLVIAGLGGVLPESVLPIVLIWLNVLLSTATVTATYAATKQVSTQRWLPLLAGIAVAAYPNQLNYARQLMTEVPSTALLAFGLVAVLHHRYVLGGLLVVIAGWFRSTLTPVVILVMVLVWLKSRRPSEPLRLFAGAMAGVLIMVLVEAAGIVAPPTNFGQNLLIAIASAPDTPDFSAPERFSPEQRANALGTYLRFAVENRGQFVGQRFGSLWQLWGPWVGEGDPAVRSRSLIDRAAIGLRSPLFLLAAIGTALNRRNTLVWVLASPLVVVTAVHVATFSTPRFSYAMEPAAIALACLAIAATWSTIESARAPTKVLSSPSGDVRE